MSKHAILEDTGLAPEVCEMVIDQIGRQPGELRLILKNLTGDGSTAIRNEDFQLLRVAATLVGGFFAAATFIGWAPVAVAGLVILLYDFRKKRIELSALQGAILRELKSHPGLTPDQIVTGMQIEGLSAKMVGDELKKLTEIQRTDHVRVHLVSVDSDGRWWAEDV